MVLIAAIHLGIQTTLKTNPKLPKSSIWQQGETWQTPLVLITLGKSLLECEFRSNGWLRSSANRVVSGSSGATAPLYTSWNATIVAWQVGCAAGEHDHGVDPTNDQGFVASSPDVL
jgi:hypothetical protein